MGWVLVSAVVVILLLAFWLIRLRRDRTEDGPSDHHLGSISDSWLSERRVHDREADHNR